MMDVWLCMSCRSNAFRCPEMGDLSMLCVWGHRILSYCVNKLAPISVHSIAIIVWLWLTPYGCGYHGMVVFAIVWFWWPMYGCGYLSKAVVVIVWRWIYVITLVLSNEDQIKSMPKGSWWTSNTNQSLWSMITKTVVCSSGPKKPCTVKLDHLPTINTVSCIYMIVITVLVPLLLRFHTDMGYYIWPFGTLV